MSQPQMTGPFRIISLIQKNPNVSDEDFLNYLKGEHREKATALVKKHNATFYSETFTAPLPTGAQAASPLGADETTELWKHSMMVTIEFSTPQDGRAFWADPEYHAMVREDTPYAFHGGMEHVAVAREEVIIGK